MRAYLLGAAGYALLTTPLRQVMTRVHELTTEPLIARYYWWKEDTGHGTTG